MLLKIVDFWSSTQRDYQNLLGYIASDKILLARMKRTKLLYKYLRYDLSLDIEIQ